MERTITTHPSPHATLALVGDDRVGAVRRARRHTLLVRLLRLVTPLLAIGAIAYYVASLQLNVGRAGPAGLRHDGVVLSTENLKMLRPRHDGFTKDRGRYVVEADSATQEFGNADMIHLDRLRSKLTKPDASWTSLTSRKGIMDTKKNQLQLIGNVTVISSSGMKARMSRAAVDLKAQHMRSDHPVVVEFPSGTVRSLRMELLADKRIVKFEGRVRVRLRKRPNSAPTSRAE